jgi:hypothetical protein
VGRASSAALGWHSPGWLCSGRSSFPSTIVLASCAVRLRLQRVALMLPFLHFVSEGGAEDHFRVVEVSAYCAYSARIVLANTRA